MNAYQAHRLVGTLQPSPQAGQPLRHSKARQALTSIFPLLLGILLVEVCLEAWTQELLGHRVASATGPVGTLPDWPKDLKNGLLIILAVASVTKVTLERRWSEFRTRADFALVALTVVMIAAGAINASPPSLIGAALFVYFRGAIVFYAWRAWNPPWRQVRPLVWIGAVLVGINVIAALIQMIDGPSVVSAMGWVDLTWIGIHRAQGLFDHPNQLGHVLGIALLGMLAFMVDGPGPAVRWWFAFAATALALAGSQSRESVIGVLVGAAVIWFLRRDGAKVIILGAIVVIGLFGAYLFVRPGNLDELSRRIDGVTNAVQTPSGAVPCDPSVSVDGCGQSQREIRVLYYQQGARLLAHRPLLGYGVGHFGGIVAYKHNPNWAKDSRFGPGGFDTHHFSDITVDSFWLHLSVETGLLGLLAYVVWLWYLARAPASAALRYSGRGPGRATGRWLGLGQSRAGPRGHPSVPWGVAALVFTAVTAFLSPSLEDAVLPVVTFSLIGMAWVMSTRPPRWQPVWRLHALTRLNGAVDAAPPAGR